jgi:regulator of RNase E activity RraA
MTRPDISETRNRLIKSFSADMYDVLDKMGYPNQCLDLNIKPLRDDMKVAGPAFTYWGMREPRFDADLPRPDFDNCAIYERFYPGCVVVINAEKDDQVGHWGEMMSYGARNAGASGAVIDGGTRDKANILKIADWSCFARYTSPVESKKRWRPKECQVPILMSGTLMRHVKVNPGDWILGDSDGVIVIPQEILQDALAAVEELSRIEELSRRDLAKGDTFKEVYNRYGRA